MSHDKSETTSVSKTEFDRLMEMMSGLQKQMSSMKRELSDEREASNERLVKRIKLDKAPVFKKKSNEKQFHFNEEVREKLSAASASLATAPLSIEKAKEALKEGNLQATCGYDKLSYSWRSKFGTKFHQSRGEHYSDGYTTGDTVGFLIHLPKRQEPTTNLPPTHKDKALIKFKNFFYFEEKDDPIEEFEKGLRPLNGSKVIFYNNGVSQGLAWSNIYAGKYFPTLSLYKGVTVTANFGPDFRYSPTDVKYKPMSDAVKVAAVEQSMSEMLFHVENNAARESSPVEPL